MTQEKLCPICGNQIFGREDKKYCSISCKNKASNEVLMKLYYAGKENLKNKIEEPGVKPSIKATKPTSKAAVKPTTKAAPKPSIKAAKPTSKAAVKPTTKAAPKPILSDEIDTSFLTVFSENNFSSKTRIFDEKKISEFKKDISDEFKPSIVKMILNGELAMVDFFEDKGGWKQLFLQDKILYIGNVKDINEAKRKAIKEPTKNKH